ncbi:MAG: Formyltetrahydrofolate deformylase, partial [uncultured Frankineae bacterium]
DLDRRAPAGAVLPRPARDRPRRLDVPGRDRVQHPRQPAVPRPRHRALLPACPRRGRRPFRPGRAPACGLRRDRDGVRHGLAARRGAPDADAAHGQQAGPLPAGPAVPAPDRCPARRADRRGVQPRGRPRARRVARRPVPPGAGDPADQVRRRGPAPRAGRADRDRARGAGALHAGAVGRAVRRAGGPGHQHPPLVPAELQGRAAVRPGARAGRQAHRRQRPLRHRGPRRGTDHRAGRRPRRPHAHGRAAGPGRSGHRGAGAGPRGPLARRAAGAAERLADRRLPL